MKRVVLALAAIALLGSQVRAEVYTVDPNHSSVAFKIKHVVGKVSGNFTKFAGTFNYDSAHLDKASAEAMIDATSINTGIEKRDNHLRTPDFFDVQKYPTINFKSTSVSDVQANKAKLHGDLTMHGVTKPVVFDLELAGVQKDPMGSTRAGATASGRVNRQEFNLGPKAGPMAGMVGDDVEISIEVEGTPKK